MRFGSIDARMPYHLLLGYFLRRTLTQIPNVISHSASIWFENWEVMGPGLKTGVS